MGRGVRRRLAFLLAGNLVLLALIFLLLKRGGSFAEVLNRTPGDIAPIALAGFALTSIVFAGAIDLSIASIIALAGTIFGAVVSRGCPAMPAFFVCFGAAWGLMAL